MYSVCIVKHLLECGVIVLRVLKEPLLGELWLGQGLCEGLDTSLREEVVLGPMSSRESISFQAKYARLLRPSR